VHDEKSRCLNYFEYKEYVEVGVELEGEMHTCWELAKQEKLDYLDVDPFPLSLLGKVLQVVVWRADKG
jgi:hypothetical protein